MRELAAWRSDPGPRLEPARVMGALRAAQRGPADDTWDSPAWLLPHQHDAARRLVGGLKVFKVALLADAAGLGKTYVALAVATRYAAVTVVAPAALRAQWHAARRQAGVTGALVSHEALSRGRSVPGAELIIVDEAHRFRNPATRRYDRLARSIGGADVLLLTATPVVNGARDLAELLRLVLADHALAALGVPSLSDHARTAAQDVTHAMLPFTVARTVQVIPRHGRMPVPRDQPVHRLPTVEPRRLGPLLTALARLRFPPLGPEHRALLHHHLLTRLASSADALKTSLDRHCRFLEEAIQAAARGERLGRRGGAVRLRDQDPDQLELVFTALNNAPLSAATLHAERRRVRRAAGCLRGCTSDPKRDALVTALRAAGRRKTIVFTTARITAVEIAVALGWHHVAVVSGSGARIASGAVPLGEALARFAPQGQRGGPVPPALRVDILVATDLASEGLNLQDADVVVHYDLPWNPLRLAQRLGRTVRLGGMHDVVEVWWFAPPDRIERKLDTLGRIARKADVQAALPVPATSYVGRARVVSSVLERREEVARGWGQPARGFAVVRGTAGGVALFHWEGVRGAIREVASLTGGPPDWHAFSEKPLRESVAADIPRTVQDALRRALRERVARSGATRLSPGGRALARRVLEQARVAGTRRDRRLLEALDGVLTRLREGVAVGAERELTTLLRDPSVQALARWLLDYPVRHPGLHSPSLETLLLGDATG